MCPNLLDAADAESPLKESELQVLRSQYLKELEAQHITVQTKFNYAWGLIKSEQHENQLEGVKLLTGISHYLHFASTVSLELMLI
jgi:mitochondrial fission 1 protein